MIEEATVIGKIEAVVIDTAEPDLEPGVRRLEASEPYQLRGRSIALLREVEPGDRA